MELGLTFPYSVFSNKKPTTAPNPTAGIAGTHTLSIYTDAKACSPSTVTAGTPLCASTCPRSRGAICPRYFKTGLRDSLAAAGFAQPVIDGYLSSAGALSLTRTHGRREVAFLNRAWDDVLALDMAVDTATQVQPLLDAAVNARPSRCVGFDGLGTWRPGVEFSLLGN